MWSYLLFCSTALRFFIDITRQSYNIRLHAFMVIAWLQNKTFLTYMRLLAFAVKLCTSSGVKRLRWLPDWLLTTYGFCCETLHQFWCETFTVIVWLTTNDIWLLLRNFASVLVRTFNGDCLTDHVRRMAFAAKICTSSGVKLLRWLSDWLPTTTASGLILLRNICGDFLTT